MFKTLRFGLLATAAIITPAAALAQAAPADTSGIEEVVVTAQKRAQNPIDVPIALKAYSGRMLNQLGIQEFDKLSLFVPASRCRTNRPTIQAS